MTYHLAQINIARLLAPIDDPQIADFVANLDRINALGDNWPGNVWRLQTEDGDATAMRVFDDPMFIINMTVWESIEALFEFTYSSDHVDIFRRRGEWFEKMEKPHLVMWWVPAGHIPTVEEAKEKLEYIEQRGPTPEAFTFKKRFTVEEMLAARESAAD